jgi:hypothetical protein
VQSWRPTGLEFALLAVIVVVIAIAAVIGGGDDGESQPARAKAPAGRPARIDVAKIERRVERMRGLRFRRPLSITFASPQRAQAIIGEVTKAEYPRRDMLVDEEELKLLGLLPPSANLERYLRAIDAEQVLGFYDDRGSKRLVVVREASAGRALQEITLAHELTHALEDQHFGIASPEGLSDDRELAEASLFEGTATALMIDYATKYFSPDDALEALGDVGDEETKLPPFIEDLLAFPYDQGERFVNSLRIGKSWRAVDKVIRFRRPQTSEQVIHLDKYATDEKPSPVTLPDAGRTLGSGWKRLEKSTLGEVDLRLLFEHVGHVRAAKSEEAEAGWGGGSFELWRRSQNGSCPSPCVARDAAVLALAWDSRRDRRQAADAFRRVFERGLEGRRLAARGGVGLWSSRGGAIGMTTRGRETRVAFAPDLETVTRILG